MVASLLIGVAETYDLVVDAKADGSLELRASSPDGTGCSSTWIGKGERHPAPVIPQPDLYIGMGSPTLAAVFALAPRMRSCRSSRDVDTRSPAGVPAAITARSALLISRSHCLLLIS